MCEYNVYIYINSETDTWLLLETFFKNELKRHSDNYAGQNNLAWDFFSKGTIQAWESYQSTSLSANFTNLIDKEGINYY